MNEHRELVALVDNAAARRLWLLSNALHCFPLDQALDLARAAEEFVTDERSSIEKGIPTPAIEVEGVVAAGQQSGPKLGDRTPVESEPQGRTTTPDPSSKNRAGLDLTREQRARLIARLAEGIKNAELAGEFGLSRKQVQGIRMGCAREIAKRREHTGEASPASDRGGAACVDEVVRYLRQQDDVVVAQEDGGFLVNGRFRMGVSDLVERANRMRIRQQKPAFEVRGHAPAQTKSFARTNGHPVFWREAPLAARSGT